MEIICNAWTICIGAILWMVCVHGSSTTAQHLLSATDEEWKKAGNCRGLWRPDKLVGTCFGLKKHTAYDDINHITLVNSSVDCRSLCCNLGDKCVSWQYSTTTAECKLGPVMRLGLEKTGKSGWCDPVPPQEWTGAKLAKRAQPGKCSWGDALPLQCFGFGDPKLNSTGGLYVSEADCAKWCCESPKCDMWQQHNDRGCFYSTTKPSKKDKKKMVNGITCSKQLIKYTGGRKCLEGYCGGLESKILPVYKKNQEQMQILKSLCTGGDCVKRLE